MVSWFMTGCAVWRSVDGDLGALGRLGATGRPGLGHLGRRERLLARALGERGEGRLHGGIQRRRPPGHGDAAVAADHLEGGRHHRRGRGVLGGLGGLRVDPEPNHGSGLGGLGAGATGATRRCVSPLAEEAGQG